MQLCVVAGCAIWSNERVATSVSLCGRGPFAKQTHCLLFQRGRRKCHVSKNVISYRLILRLRKHAWLAWSNWEFWKQIAAIDWGEKRFVTLYRSDSAFHMTNLTMSPLFHMAVFMHPSSPIKLKKYLKCPSKTEVESIIIRFIIYGICLRNFDIVWRTSYSTI